MLDSRPLEIPAAAQLQDDQLLHRNLRRLALAVFVLAAMLSGFEVLTTPPERSQAGVAAAMSAFALLAYLMLWQRRISQASVLLVVALLGAGAWAMQTYGSVRASGSFTMVVAVVLAGTYLSRWAVIVTTLASVLILGAVSWAEVHGLLAQAEFSMDFRYLFSSGVYIGVMGAMLHHTRRSTDEAYTRRLNQMEDRLRVEDERDQSLRRFSRIFALTPTALMIQSARKQEVLDVNPAFECSLGYEAKRIAGRSAGSLWASDLQWREHLRTLFERGATGWQQALWLRADGQAMDVWVFSELSEEHSGMLIITTVAEWPPEAV